MLDKASIRRGAQIELARRDLWWYCHTKSPKFYKKNRQYLKDLCGGIQDFIASDEDILIIAAPPRHGKSRTIGNAVEWVLGQGCCYFCQFIMDFLCYFK